MWNIILEHLPGKLTIICTILAYVIPFSVYKINRKLHKDNNPPWKKEQE